MSAARDPSLPLEGRVDSRRLAAGRVGSERPPTTAHNRGTRSIESWPAQATPPRSATRTDPPLEGEGEARAWQAAASVLDPEIPVLTIADLGILRSVDIVDGVAVAKLTPTYSGCPAVLAIELAVEAALRDAGFEPRIERVMSPAWTTDWITEEGRAKLKAYGIAPPEKASNSIRALFGETEVECPRCGSHETVRISEFGSTACKALYRCKSCRDPFDYFKCI